MYHSTYVYIIPKLEHTQNNVARPDTITLKYDYITPVLVTFKILLLVYKTLHGMGKCRLSVNLPFPVHIFDQMAINLHII